MSLQYVLHLTSSERALLTRIAKGRCGRRHPAGGKMERARALLKCDDPEGEGWTDEAIAAALDVSARSVGRWRRQAVEEGPEAARERRGPANWTAQAKRSACSWPRRWKRGRSWPRSATKPCAAL